MRILVVDDSRFMRRYLSAVLSDDGHDVEAVATAVEAMSLADGTSFDVVVVDRILPEMSGAELCRYLSSRGASRKPVLILYSSITSRAAAGHGEALAAGADAFVVKDAEGLALMRKIRSLAPTMPMVFPQAVEAEQFC